MESISKYSSLCYLEKGYHFLHPRTGFARILSCILGVETISHRIHKEALREIGEGTNYSDIPSCVRECHILPNSQKILQTNSVLLSRLAESIELEFKVNVIVENKGLFIDGTAFISS